MGELREKIKEKTFFQIQFSVSDTIGLVEAELRTPYKEQSRRRQLSKFLDPTHLRLSPVSHITSLTISVEWQLMPVTLRPES